MTGRGTEAGRRGAGDPRPVAVLGATGVVGRAAVRMLTRLGIGELRLGARTAPRAEPSALPPGAEQRRVDAGDPDALAEFCAGTRLVLNCAGPSYLLMDRVARAALAAGSDYVDVSGDGPTHRLLDGSPLLDGRRTAVLSAGMLPGLANVVPRVLADDLTGARLVVYAGGIEPFAPASAGDLALSLDSSDDDHWYGETLAAWLGGRRRRNALPVREDVEVAGFPGRVTTMPFLTADAERLARSAGLDELRWHNVFVGGALRLTLSRLRGRVPADPAALAPIVTEIRAAAELDLAGLDPFYLMAFTVHRADRIDTAVLRTPSSFELTAATAAHTVEAVLSGAVAPGLHYADDVLDPRGLLDTVAALGALPVFRTHRFAHDEPMEAGSL
ncbi:MULTISPECIES: saccharopine dehydrogenase NADP-binding domain-containing protein [Nocardia]|uniref:saccharopine dehydrogenase NADP-binding domain-containing protein n=1 Tax=Nocardia abscessus TaxID=120957 RepID=UPI00189494F4|nr:saccharopine dehydrogenase NADP-binding domain-containing protein [Nocardia abscessus]MBF6476496.1 saccharopine dehydrogenase NADP-binding domain-containing protein [Nocardia abscessus]